MSEEVRCPHCEKPLSATTVAKVKARSEIQFVMHSAPGELLQADTIGGCMTQLGKLFNSAGTDAGYPTITLVKGITMDDAGSVTITMLVARGPEAMERRARFRKRRTERKSP